MSTRDTTVLTDKRWLAYATAGAAGAATMVGVAENAEALTIIDVNVTLEDQQQGDGYFDVFGPYTFGGAGASFNFQQAFNEIGTSVGILTAVGAGNFSFVGFAAGPYFYASNLAYGAAISSGPFGVAAGDRADLAWGAGYSNSQFLSPGVGYVGFRFDLGGGTQYGWAEIDMNGAPDNRAFFSRYAYGDVGESVFAGVGNPQPMPEPGSLALLAIGGGGLLAWRRRRSNA